MELYLNFLHKIFPSASKNGRTREAQISHPAPLFSYLMVNNNTENEEILNCDFVDFTCRSKTSFQ